MVVRGARLRGEEIRLSVSGVIAGKAWNHLFRGKLTGDRIEGEVIVSDGEARRTLTWTATRTP